MTTEQQNRAIAEFDGWREAFPEAKDPHPETKKGGILLPYEWVNEITHARAMNLPDYSKDMNAIHSALNKLDNWSGERLIENLCLVRCGWEHNTYFDLFVRSTPEELSEALLRTIHKWK